jgi:hypothetical protein
MKPVIKKIEFTKEQQEEIDLINKGEVLPMVKTRIGNNGIKHDVVYNRRFTYTLARKRLASLYGGLCSTCGDWPSYKVSHDVGDKNQGAWLVSRYCSPCYDKWKGGINWKKKS